ncbi:MAG: hypothetical protein V1672_05405 [Candidatus Diapherotrites archaeon]
MRYQTEDILNDLKMRLETEKGIRNKVLLQNSIESLQQYHEETRRKMM